MTDYADALTQIRNLLAEQPTPQARKVAISMLDGLIAASAGEAGTATTVEQGVAYEHAVGNAETPQRGSHGSTT